MDSQNQHTYYAELISRYLSGNANSEEIAELEAWVSADPENKAQFIAYKKAWMLAGIEKSQETVNVEELWQQTSSQLFKEAKVLDMKPEATAGRRKWWGVAAAVILLLVASVWLFRNMGNQALLYKTADNTQTIALADGSNVILNRASTLRFTPEDENGHRKVELTGDAFFDVARDEAHPFVIKAGEVEVEVLGTSFYVDSREQQNQVQVIVQSGRVAVRAATEQEILVADEKAIFRKQTGTLNKLQNEDVNYLSLQTNTLLLDSLRIEEVLFVLNRHFNVNISLENEELKDCILNSTISFEDKSLETILEFLKASNGFEVKRNGRKIVLSGGNCDP